MVSKLNNSQITEHWDDIKEAALASFPRQPKDVDMWFNTLLQKLLQQQGQVWIGLYESKIHYVCITLFLEDPCGAGRQLLIYSLYGYELIPDVLWNETKNGIITFARQSKCDAIVAYTRVDRIKEMAAKLGCDTKTTFIIFEV